jgi:transcription elongation GreA/GreB family factor
MSISAISQPGRSQIQRDLKHLVRDVRHEVKAETKELRSDGDQEKIAAVRAAYADFSDQVQGAFKDAGQGNQFDAAAVPEGLRQAMISFTETLRTLNGTVGSPVKEPGGTPVAAPDLPSGTLLDVTA